jgi:hypothetical protein
MAGGRVASTLAAALAFAAASPAVGLAYGHSDTTFQVSSISGADGTAYVFLQARQRGETVEPVPTRRLTGCPTRWYMAWTNVQRDADLTSYDIEIRWCRTGAIYDDGVQRGGAIAWSPGHRTLLAGGFDRQAGAALIYALAVGVEPREPEALRPARITAAVDADFVSQVDRALDISVDPAGWNVTGWDVDFGDGGHTSFPGGPRSLEAPHLYLSGGPEQPRVVAHVAGMAEVADFDTATGAPTLLREPFKVDVASSTSVQVGAAVSGYTPPQARAGVVPRLDAGPAPEPGPGLTAIEAPRGAPVWLWPRPVVDREGLLSIAGAGVESGRSRLLGWRLLAGSPDGPPAEVNPPGASGGPGAPIVQQWNTPDRIGAAGPEPYEVVVAFTMRTDYPDGGVRDTDFTGAIEVRVGYSASTG